MGDQEKLDEFVANKVEGGLTKKEKIAISKQAAELTDVNINLAYARMAVSFVKEKVSLVANWDERLDTSAEGIYRVGLERAKSSNEADQAEAHSRAAWNQADKCVYGNLRQNKEWQAIDAQTGGVQDLQDIQILSDLAEQHGCGNCGELTAVTFICLYHLSVRPLDYMILKPPLDHAFVVIGRNGNKDNDIFGRNWGDDAVVCDPWASGLREVVPFYGSLSFGDSYSAYSAAFLEQNMKAMHKSFSGVKMRHREK